MSGPASSQWRVDGDADSAKETLRGRSFVECRRALVKHPDAMVIILGALIGLGVCAPFVGLARVFFLDSSVGPHAATITPTVLGLNGGLTAGIGGSLAEAILSHLVGGAATWLPIFAFFPIAMAGAGRLAGGSPWSRLAAGLLYAVNPFVFNRIFVGHLPLLIGYALLPFAIASALRSLSSPVSRWPVTALWWAGLTLLSPHFAWIFGVVVMGTAVVAVVTRQGSVARLVGWLAATLGGFALMSTYILLPSSVANLPTRVGSVSLAVYRTTGDPHLGLFANVLSLYGFWRTGPGPELPKEVVIGWPFLMFAILLLVAVGVWHAFGKFKAAVRSTGGAASGSRVGDSSDEHDKAATNRVDWANDSRLSQHSLALLLFFAGIAGYFLSLGNQGPTGGLFLWAYDHVPFFSVMREPQKFLMLLAVAYAVFFGWGVERFSGIDLNPRRIGTIATAALIGLALPLSYTATIFDGLNGQVSASHLPGAYQQANIIMGDGVGNILYLPWHLYLEYPFTDGRVVANVAPTSFSRNVISGDDVQVDDVETQSTSPRSAYLERLDFEGSQLTAYGALVAPLGVKYVVLAKAVDWRSYNWLGRQRDLKLVLDDASLEVWLNEAYDGVGHGASTLRSVAGFKTLLALASAHHLGNGVAVVRRRSTTRAIGHGSSRHVRELSPVAYQIGPGGPGWVGVDAAYQKGWSLDGRAAIESAEGTVLVRANASGGVLQFTPWGLVRLGYIVSAGTFICLAGVALFYRRREAEARVR